MVKINPLTYFRKFRQLEGRYCLPTAQAGWRNMPNLSQREAFTIVDGHPVTSHAHLLLFIWTRNQTHVDYIVLIILPTYDFEDGNEGTKKNVQSMQCLEDH